MLSTTGTEITARIFTTFCTMYRILLYIFIQNYDLTFSVSHFQCLRLFVILTDLFSVEQFYKLYSRQVILGIYFFVSADFYFKTSELLPVKRQIITLKDVFKILN